MATENAVMTYNDAGYQLPLTISGSGNYNYLLRTKDTYLNKDITITTSTAAAVPEADNANADVTLFTTDGSNAGVNISAIVGTKATAEPTSGYYLAFKGSGRSKITTAGWIGTGALNTSTSDAKYFPITAANGSITKVSQNLNITASLEESNTLTWSDSNTSGIAVTAKANASGSLSARIDISQAGYVPQGNNWKSGSLTISAAGTPTSAIKYLTAVNIASGKSFTVTNAGTLTVTNTGTTTVTSNSTSAGTVTIAAKKTSDASANTSVQVIASGLLSFKTVSFGGQTLTNTNYSKTDLAVSFASGSDTNMSNITYGAKDTTNYPFYYKISGSTPAVSGTTTVSIGAVTYSNDLGLVDAHSGATALNATSSSPTVSVNAGAGSTYIKIKKITVGTKINGSDGTVTPVIKRTAIPDGDQWTDAANGAEVSTKPDSGVYVQVDAQAVAKSFSVEGTVTSSGYGTADNGTTTGTYTKATAQSITAGSGPAATKWIPIKTTSVNFTAGALNNKSATIKTQTNVVANSTNNSGVAIVLQGTAGCSSSTYTNNAGWLGAHSNTTTNTAISKQTWDGTTYYINSVDIIANKTFAVTSNAGTVNVTNSGTTTITSGIASSTPKGTISISAYPASGTTIESAKSIVQNGRWQCLNSSGTVVNSVTNGTYYGKVTVAAGSVTAPATISGSSATVTTGTNTVTFTKTISVTPNVTTAGYISSGTAGNSSVSLTASITTKAAATITPGTSNKEIAAGTYLTGKQTIAGDADLVASNIKHNVNIFGVTGTFTSSGTQSSGQTVASAAHIRSGYSAWVNGQEVQGSIGAVSFANDLPSGQEQSNYSDISDVTGTPVLVAGKGLYISAGYIENTYISTAHLVPDGTDVQGHAGYILSGHTALDQDGNLVTGNIPSRSWPTTTSTSATSGYSGTTFNASTSERYINLPSGYYGSNNYYFIRKITTGNISKGNIKFGVTITVGDSGSSTRIANVAGEFTKASTATSSNGAAAATQILKDYGAWVDGTEITGSIPTYTGAYTITT